MMVWWLVFGAVMFFGGAGMMWLLVRCGGAVPVDPPRSGGRATRPDELRSMRVWQEGLEGLARADGWHDPDGPAVFLWDLRVTRMGE